MRKLVFVLTALVMGAFAFASGSPVSAAPVGAVASMSDLVQVKTENVHYRRYWHRHRWHRHRHWHHRRHWRRHYHRRCFWRYGRRYCRW